jgi:ATP-binding cassette subfamily B protein
VTSYLASFIMVIISQRYSYDLRMKIAVKINQIPLRYFDSHPSGDLMSLLTNDVDMISSSLSDGISMFLQSLFLLVGVLIAMFVTSWQMALAALITLPLMAIAIAFILGLAVPWFKKRQDDVSAVNSAAEENYGGQSVIKVFSAEEPVNQKFDVLNKKLRKSMFFSHFFGGLMQPMMNVIGYLAYATVCITGGLLMHSGAGVTFGTITAFLIYVQLFQNPLSQIAQALNSLSSAGASADRVFGFLAEKELSDESQKSRKLLGADGKEQVRGEVEFRDIHFSYDPGKEIIHGFSAKVKPGSKVAIVGPTGAGKTTMVNLLMRFYETDSGDILIDGVSLRDMPRAEIHDIFGMVLQDTWTFEGTLRENIVYNTPDVSEEELRKALEDSNLTHYVSTLPGGLDYRLSESSAISSGQKQLLTIARAMVKKAPLLILDEATSNVDTRTEEQIQESMDRLTQGRTSFVIAHRLSTIRNADLILVMKDGNIVEQGTHESLLAQNGFYASLYQAQFSENG